MKPGTTKRSPYKVGWLMVMFDLPVMTEEERKEATDFRKYLLDSGYIMVQFSIYARTCVTYEYYDKHLDDVKNKVPCGGNVKIIYITDAQWQRIITVAGEDYYKGKWESHPEMPEQMIFWE